MKIKLLNNGLYPGLEKVKFPLTVNASRSTITSGFEVHTSELASAGGDASWVQLASDNAFVYFSPWEVEVLP